MSSNLRVSVLAAVETIENLQHMHHEYNKQATRITFSVVPHLSFFLHGEGPRSRFYGHTTALRLFVQPCDEDEQFFLPSFTSNGAPVE
jgi:hypothetical protein